VPNAVRTAAPAPAGSETVAGASPAPVEPAGAPVPALNARAADNGTQPGGPGTVTP
jgi:hypothetical protein